MILCQAVLLRLLCPSNFGASSLFSVLSTARRYDLEYLLCSLLHPVNQCCRYLTRAAMAASGGRSLLHFDHPDDHHNGGGGGQSGQCECKHADWYSYGYCNVGTTSGDVRGCQQAYLVCCGWAKVCLICSRDINQEIAG